MSGIPQAVRAGDGRSPSDRSRLPALPALLLLPAFLAALAAPAAFAQKTPGGNLIDPPGSVPAPVPRDDRAEQARREAEARRREAEREKQAETERRLAAERKLQEAAAEIERLKAQQSAAPPVTPGREFRERLKSGGEGPLMVAVPGGRFEMGSPEGETGRNADEGPVHGVAVQAFALGRYEVTVGEFRRFVTATGYRTDAERNAGGRQGCYAWDAADDKWEWRAGRHWGSPGYAQEERHPVACVSWADARAYVKWLAVETGGAYRLPSEAEWEYAARAGSRGARPWGEDGKDTCRHANVADRTKGPQGQTWREKFDCEDGHWYAAPVGSYRANGFGLNDLLGNVWEWVEDCWHDSYTGAPVDGSAWVAGKCESRVLRGGSWDVGPGNLRSAFRIRDAPDIRFYPYGFRVARTLP